MGRRSQWDRDAQPAPAWARNLVRRAYLIEAQDAAEPGEKRIFETSHPCAVGDLVTLPASVLAPHAGSGTWRIVAREPADEPYAARLVVAPAGA